MLCEIAFQEVGARNNVAAVPSSGSKQNTSSGLSMSLGNVDNVHSNDSDRDFESHDHCSQKHGSVFFVLRFRRFVR
jgi:hypothetical protein